MVNNDRRTKLFLRIILGQIMVGLLVCFVALFVLFYIQGNRFNFKRLKIIRTGVISIEYLPKDSEVYINNKKAKAAKSFIRNLSPALYSFKIIKDGYSPWQIGLDIEQGSVNVYKDVILFKKNPVPEPLTDERKISLLKTPNELLAAGENRGLYVNSYEIWVLEHVIARFSTPVRGAVWYSDNAHILYQQGQEIRIIEKNGQNDTLLVVLDQDSPSKFTSSANGEELYYSDGDAYKVAKIR